MHGFGRNRVYLIERAFGSPYFSTCPQYEFTPKKIKGHNRGVGAFIFGGWGGGAIIRNRPFRPTTQSENTTFSEKSAPTVLHALVKSSVSDCFLK